MKNRMKKLVSLILMLVFSCTMLFGMTACQFSNGDTAALNDQIETLTKQLDDVNTKMLELEAEKALLESELSDLETETNAQISNLNKEKEELKAMAALSEKDLEAATAKLSIEDVMSRRK